MLERKSRFRHESLQDKKSIQDLLKSIAKGISKGKLQFSDQDGEIVMEPEGLLNLKVTASEDESSHRLDIRISWKAEEKPLKKGTLAVK